MPSFCMTLYMAWQSRQRPSPLDDVEVLLKEHRKVPGELSDFEGDVGDSVDVVVDGGLFREIDGPFQDTDLMHLVCPPKFPN